MKTFKNSFMTVTSIGASMVPFLCPGMRLRLVPLGRGHLWPGQIVSVPMMNEKNIRFRKLGLSTHRVIWASNNYLITKGDNNFHVESYMLSDNLSLFVVVAVEYNKKIYTLEGLRHTIYSWMLLCINILQVLGIHRSMFRVRQYIARAYFRC